MTCFPKSIFILPLPIDRAWHGAPVVSQLFSFHGNGVSKAVEQKRSIKEAWEKELKRKMKRGRKKERKRQAQLRWCWPYFFLRCNPFLSHSLFCYFFLSLRLSQDGSPEKEFHVRDSHYTMQAAIHNTHFNVSSAAATQTRGPRIHRSNLWRHIRQSIGCRRD